MTRWQEIKMCLRWGVGYYLFARAIQLMEREASTKLAAAFMDAALEIEKFQKQVAGAR